MADYEEKLKNEVYPILDKAIKDFIGMIKNSEQIERHMDRVQ